MAFKRKYSDADIKRIANATSADLPILAAEFGVTYNSMHAMRTRWRYFFEHGEFPAKDRRRHTKPKADSKPASKQQSDRFARPDWFDDDPIRLARGSR